jgi:MFS superfamily sulfate permease-like transporter
MDSIFSVLKLLGSMIFDLIRKRNGNWKDDTLSGLTVALALVPEAIAFSFIAGVGPLVGLWAAVFYGLNHFGFWWPAGNDFRIHGSYCESLWRL